MNNRKSSVGTQQDYDDLYTLESRHNRQMRLEDKKKALSSDGLITGTFNDGDGRRGVVVDYIRPATDEYHGFNVTVKHGKYAIVAVRVQDEFNGYVREFKMQISRLTDLRSNKKNPNKVEQVRYSPTDFQIKTYENFKDFDSTGHMFEETDTKIFNAFIEGMKLFNLTHWDSISYRYANRGDMSIFTEHVLKPYAEMLNGTAYMFNSEHRPTVLMLPKEVHMSQDKIKFVRHYFKDKNYFLSQKDNDIYVYENI